MLFSARPSVFVFCCLRIHVIVQIEKAHLFDLSTDPRETNNLVEQTSDEGCCPKPKKSAPSNSGAAVEGEGEVPASCFEAAQYPSSLLKQVGGEEGQAAMLTTEVCCHLQNAAVVFAGSNLEFFGRRGYEQEGEDKQPTVKRPKV